MGVKQAIEAGRAALARAAQLREALGRAEARVPEAQAEADAADRALTRAHADAMMGSTGDPPPDLTAFTEKAERAERAAHTAGQVVIDLRRRIFTVHHEIGTARTDLEAARSSSLEAAFASLLAEARRVLQPVRAQVELLRKTAPPFYAAGPAQALEGVFVNLDLGGPATETGALAKSEDALRDLPEVLADLGRVEEELRQLVERYRERTPAERAVQGDANAHRVMV